MHFLVICQRLLKTRGITFTILPEQGPEWLGTFQAPSGKGDVIEDVEEARALVVPGSEGAHERKNGCAQLGGRSIHHLQQSN